MVDEKQDIDHGSPKCYNGSAQLVQLKQPPYHREESGTRVEFSSTPLSQELFIDPSPWCLPLHTALTLREIIVSILAGQDNARHPEGDTEDGIEDSDEEGFQNSDGITPTSKEVLLVSQKEKRKLNDIQQTEEVLIDAYGGKKG